MSDRSLQGDGSVSLPDLRVSLTSADEVEVTFESADATEALLYLDRTAAVTLGLDLIQAATAGVSELAALLSASHKVPVKTKGRTPKQQADVEAFTTAVVDANKALRDAGVPI